MPLARVASPPVRGGLGGRTGHGGWARLWLLVAILALALVAALARCIWYGPSQLWEAIQWGAVPDYGTFVALAIAILGLDSWRRQLRGTHDFDLARRILMALYEVRDTVRDVRNPWMDISEGDASGGDAEWTATAYNERWERVRAAQRKLASELPESEAVWSDDLKPEVSALNRHVNKLFVVTRRHVMSRRGDLRYGATEAADEEILYALDSDRDQYEIDLLRLVTAIEDKIRPRLGRR